MLRAALTVVVTPEHESADKGASNGGHPPDPTKPVVTLLTENSMKKLTTAVRNFIREDDGAALVEYAILVALIAVVAIFFVTSMGTKVSQKFSSIDKAL
jgi:pilus assembly protein Flp/PilA